MNLLDMLSKELQGKDWTLEEKARYLYIRICELFTYDPRYKLCNEVEFGEQLRKEILEQKIDLENVKSSWIVCTSYVNELYITLLKILLNINAKDEKIKPDSIHTWTEFYDGKQMIKADSALKAFPDLTRIKMKLQTQDYHPKKEEETYKDHLKEIDKTIGYIEKEYEDIHLESLRKNLAKLNFKNDEILLYKWNIITRELQRYAACKFPINLHLCMRYLILHLLNTEEQKLITTQELFQLTKEKEWCFANIYILNLQQGKYYFIQPRFQNTFNFYQIDKETANHYQRKMRLIKTA